MLSSSIVPPCTSTIVFAIEIPSPVPWIALLVAPAARKNRSKSSCCSSSAMPMPVSATSKTARSSRRVSDSVTRPPAGVNLIAFETRLSSS